MAAIGPVGTVTIMDQELATAAPHQALDAQPPDFAKRTRMDFMLCGLGLILLGAGLVTILMLVPAIDSLVIGLAMLLASGLNLTLAPAMRPLDTARSWLLSDMFYLAAGLAIVVVIEPLISLRTLSLALAVLLGLSGIGRLVVGIRASAQWILVSGCTSILSAMVIGIDWNEGSLRAMGVLIGLDLIAQGAAALRSGFGHRLAVVDLGE